MKLIVNGEVAQIPTGGGGAASSIPTGGIIMWSGADVPDGWALCNGENGTPDLRGRFVLGVSETHKIGSVGGDEKVKLTTNQLPPHVHNYDAVVDVGTSSQIGGNLTNVKVYYQETRISGFTGGGEAHNNMPPYYTLAYIMKL